MSRFFEEMCDVLTRYSDEHYTHVVASVDSDLWQLLEGADPVDEVLREGMIYRCYDTQSASFVGIQEKLRRFCALTREPLGDEEFEAKTWESRS